MTTEQLEAIAEGDEHAAWIVQEHAANVQAGARDGRCTICEQWWPCDKASLAALAVLRAREVEQLRAALKGAMSEKE